MMRRNSDAMSWMGCFVLLACTLQACVGFTALPLNRHDVTCRQRRHSLHASRNESDEEATMKEKMERVRALQSAFYANPGTAGPTLELETGILQNLPLWRVPWTELPGRSNVLHVHEPIYTNMFETILNHGPKPWYVGHLYLPGGSQNLKSDQFCYQLKTWKDEVDDERRQLEPIRSAVVGTLLQIADYRRLSDGRLILLVQAMDRFVVVRSLQSLPYSMADVQILPDEEEMGNCNTETQGQLQRSQAVQESFRYHDYEYDTDFRLQPLVESPYLSVTDFFGPDLAKILPFVPYSSTIDPPVPLAVVGNNGSSDEVGSETNLEDEPAPLESYLRDGNILRQPPSHPELTAVRRNLSIDELEDQLWIAMEDFVRFRRIVLPAQVMCLLPPHRTWGGLTDIARLSSQYLSIRRQRRLSFVAPFLLENTNVGRDLRQVWLETPSIHARLSAILERFDMINNVQMGEFQ